MDDSTIKLSDQAIQAALLANWEDALLLNQQIIALQPENTDALNRTARAYFELGNYSEAKKFYQSSLKIDPYNQIAAKFLKRIEVFAKKGSSSDRVVKKTITSKPFNLDLFIEEPGKTKVVSLLKVAEPQRISMLSSGDEVVISPKNRSVSVTDIDNGYIGVLPDDTAHQLLRLIKGGNKYQAFIKTVKTNALSILIREVHRSTRFKNQPSFLDSTMVVTYSSDHITLLDENAEPTPEEETEELERQ